MLEAFEMWLWRRILRVSWTEKLMNECVKDRIGVSEERSLLEEVKRRKIRKHGHWKKSESFMLVSIEGEK